MRQIKSFLGILFALFLASLTMGSAALAESGLLPRPTTQRTVKSGASVNQSANGTEIKCTSDEGVMTFENDKKGVFDLLLLGCTGPLSVKCKGLSDTINGSVLAKGNFTIDKLTILSAKPDGILLAPEEIHLSCGAVLEAIRGRAVGRLSVSGSKLVFKFLQSKGKDELTEDETESGLDLEESTSGGKFESDGFESTEEAELEAASELMN